MSGDHGHHPHAPCKSPCTSSSSGGLGIGGASGPRIRATRPAASLFTTPRPSGRPAITATNAMFCDTTALKEQAGNPAEVERPDPKTAGLPQPGLFTFA